SACPETRSLHSFPTRRSSDLGDTPCAVISRATTPYQRTHRSTIADLHRSPKLVAPTLLVVGEVVRFADPVTLSQEFGMPAISARSEEHTSELQSRSDIVCRLL